MTAKEKEERRLARGRESLGRAVTGHSLANDLIVYTEFSARGIDAIPRVNVFTYSGWLAKGRQVRKGEHGVKITTYIPVRKRDSETGELSESLRPRVCTVFHVSQTEAREGVCHVR